MKKAPKSFLALLLLIMILFSGCRKEALYPETEKDMIKLLQENQSEFDEFALWVMDNLPEGMDELRLAYIKANQWSFYLYDREDLFLPENKDISSLKNGAKIKKFLDKYKVFSLYATENNLSFSLYPSTLEDELSKKYPAEVADKLSNWFNIPSDFQKFSRDYYYSPKGLYKPEHVGYVNDHWLAAKPYQETRYYQGFGTYLYSVRSLKEKGYTFVKPKIHQIEDLNFLYSSQLEKQNESSTTNRITDYLYEIDDEHLLLIYEKERELRATLFNWQTETEVQTIKLDLHGGLVGLYHVERLKDNTFAYAANVGKEGTEEILSLITIENNKIEVASLGVLPIKGRWADGMLTINAELNKMAYYEEGQVSIVWGDWVIGRGFIERGSWSYEDLGIDSFKNFKRLYLFSNDQMAFTWEGSFEEGNIQINGYGVIDLQTQEVLNLVRGGYYRLRPTKNGALIGGYNLDYTSELFAKTWPDIKKVYDSFSEQEISVPEYYIDTIGYVSERGIKKFGLVETTDDTRYFIPGYHEEYFAIELLGNNKYTVNEHYVAWYNYQTNTWDNEIWVVDLKAIGAFGQSKTDDIRAEEIYCMGTTGKRVYSLGQDEFQKTVLNVIELK
ncbi:MAG: hypothetical protein GX138_06955 [Firmicutes bacterium]|nr:hypothetical protein [Bacillota bacterium]